MYISLTLKINYINLKVNYLFCTDNTYITDAMNNKHDTYHENNCDIENLEPVLPNSPWTVQLAEACDWIILQQVHLKAENYMLIVKPQVHIDSCEDILLKIVFCTRKNS